MVNILEQPEDNTQNPRAVRRRIAFLIRHIYSQLSVICWQISPFLANALTKMLNEVLC